MSVRKGFIVSILAVIFASFNSHEVNAQYDEDSRPYPELSAGLKAVMGYFEFGKNYYQSTGDNALGFQPTVRYDLPVKLFTIKDRPAYITFNFATGILYVVNNETSVNGFDPVSGQPNSFIKHKSPVFVPIYVGLYNPGAFGLGLEAFYAKGFNGGYDIWGAKLLGLSYNHRKFRVNAAYEMAVPVKSGGHAYDPSQYFSLEFLWKFNRPEE